MNEKERQIISATEIVQKQMQLLLDVSESIHDNQDKVRNLCMISEAMAQLMASLPDELR